MSVSTAGSLVNQARDMSQYPHGEDVDIEKYLVVVHRSSERSIYRSFEQHRSDHRFQKFRIDFVNHKGKIKNKKKCQSISSCLCILLDHLINMYTADKTSVLSLLNTLGKSLIFQGVKGECSK